MTGISDIDFLEEILDSSSESSTQTRFAIPTQYGPLRYFDREMQCLSSFNKAGLARVTRKGGNCRTPTHYKLNGIPTCVVCALMEMNYMLHELGVGA